MLVNEEQARKLFKGGVEALDLLLESSENGSMVCAGELKGHEGKKMVSQGSNVHVVYKFG